MSEHDPNSPALPPAVPIEATPTGFGSEDVPNLNNIAADASRAAGSSQEAAAGIAEANARLGAMDTSLTAGFGGVEAAIGTLGGRVDAGFQELGTATRTGQEAMVLGVEDVRFAIDALRDALVEGPRRAAEAQAAAHREHRQVETEQRWIRGLTAEEPLSPDEQNAVRRRLGLPALYSAPRDAEAPPQAPPRRSVLRAAGRAVGNFVEAVGNQFGYFDEGGRRGPRQVRTLGRKSRQYPYN